MGSVDASYDDACEGTVDRLNLTYYYCIGNVCVTAKTSQNDSCTDTSTSCSANNWVCTGTPGTLTNTATSGTDSCTGACQKTNYACTTQDGSVADRCTGTTTYLSEGKACNAGAEVTPNSTSKCDQTIDCLLYGCTAATYYRGCTAGSTVCTETGKQAGTAWTASSTNMSNETNYKVGSTCNVVWSLMCAAPSVGAPTVNLYSPNAGYSLSVGSATYVNFSCYATDDTGLKNISLWLTNSSNQSYALNVTTNVSGLYNLTNWSVELTIGNYTWNCRAYDTAGNNAYASVNRTVAINESPPTITSVILNATSNGNTTANNLTAYPQWLNFDEGANIRINYDWRLSGTSIALINMNFDVNNSARSGATRDFSSYSRNGSVTGATWNATGGQNGTGAYAFNALTDMITVNSSTGLDIDVWTAEMTVKLNADSSATLKRVFTTPSTFTYRYIAGFNTAGANFNANATVVCYTTNNGFSTPVNSVPKNQWVHIVIRKNAGNSFWVYINGVNQTLTTGTATCSLVVGNFSIGNRPDGAASINGSMDRFVFYSRALSPEEIVALYNNRTSILVSQELAVSDSWTTCVNQNNGLVDGSTVCSNAVTIRSNAAPSMTSVTLNSTSPYNSSLGNLTAYPQGLIDVEGDFIDLNYDWRLNGSSIAVVNMNFDVNNSAGPGTGLGATKDYSTRSNNGTVSEAIWNASGGKNSTGAYVLDGVNDRIYLASPKLSATSNYTVSAWIKPRGYPDTTYNGIVSWGGRSCSGTDTIVLSINNAGRPVWASFCNDYGAASGNTATLNQWNHIAGVLRGNNVTLYMNGGSVTGTLSASLSPTPTATNFVIGCTDYTARCFNGTIDDVLILNRSLSDEEILALYNNRTDILAKQEIKVLNNWTTCVTPNDGLLDGTTTCSNALPITSPTSCEYTGSGSWTVSCTQACRLLTNVNLNRNNLTFNGSGTVYVTSTINNVANLFILASCNVNIGSGGNITVQQA